MYFNAAAAATVLRLQRVTSEADVGACTSPLVVMDRAVKPRVVPADCRAPLTSCPQSDFHSDSHSPVDPCPSSTHACSKPAETRRDRCPTQPSPPPLAGCHDSSLKIQAAAAACELLSQSTVGMQSAAQGFRSSAASRTSSRQKAAVRQNQAATAFGLGNPRFAPPLFASFYNKHAQVFIF